MKYMLFEGDMNKNKSINITKGILYSFISLILVYLLVSFYFIHSIRTLNNLTKTIYDHPLVVSNAALKANAEILKMHRNMKDTVLSNNPEMLADARKKIRELEANALYQLRIVESNILGDAGIKLVEETIGQVNAWKSIREKVFTHIKEGRIEKAADITMEEGADHVFLLENKMLELTTYARTKASGFFQESVTVHAKIKKWTFIFLGVFLFIFLGVIFYTLKWTTSSEKVLSEEREKLNVTLRSIGDGVIATNRKGKVSLLNRVAESLTGWEERDVLGRDVESVFNIINEKSRASCENPVQKVLSTESVVALDNHTVLISKNGTERIIADSGAPIKGSDGKIIGVVLVFRDQTEEHRAHTRVIESEEKFRLLSENTLDVIWAMDMDLVFTYVNPAIYPLTGYTVEEWIGSRLPDHCDEENFLKMGKIISDEVPRGTESRGVAFEAVLNTKNGEPVPFEIRGKLVFDKNGKPVGLQGVSRDISERKKAEKEKERLHRQLLQAQKMESVGRLAGGVAHDFNNMLGVIIGYTELLMDSKGPEDPAYNDLEEILKAANRSSEITRQLLAFARKQTISPQVVDLNSTVESMLKMMRRLIGEDIDLAWLPCEGLLRVNIDPMQVNQIMANLCVNARDAISGIGKVTIETDFVSFDEEYCSEHPGFSTGEYIMLSVSDDGIGMAPETIEKIFDPFFTTKELGQGTGLGLSTVYGIVKQNEGFINIYSEPEKGTTFKVYLPCYSGDLSSMKNVEFKEVSSGSGETVLIVEDDPSILKIGIRVLENLNYKVLSAASPGEAIGLVREYRGNIDLLITDVIMPEMNGRDLSKRVKLFYPDLKVLFMSGYTANVIAHRGVLDRGVFFVQKPFSKKDFSVKIREALENGTDSA